jgi:tellurite resistance protein TehA-like permease
MLITLRFIVHRGSFERSFLEPSESLFIPASVISVGIILMTIAQYGIPETGRWLQVAFKVLFWIYAALAFLSSCCIYLIL